MNREAVVKAELMGAERDLLVEYELDAGRPIIHTVQMIRQRAGYGEFWYDQDGKPVPGPVFGAVWLYGYSHQDDVLDRMQIQRIADEIEESLIALAEAA